MKPNQQKQSSCSSFVTPAAAPKESEIERLTVPLHTDMGPGRRAGVEGAGCGLHV